MANKASPLNAKLEAMILTLQMFRDEMDGSRVPKYEETFLKK